MTTVLSIVQSLWNNDNIFLFCFVHLFLIIIAFILFQREIRNNEQQDSKSSSSTLKLQSLSSNVKNDIDEKDTLKVEKTEGLNNSKLTLDKQENHKREDEKAQPKSLIHDPIIQLNEDSNESQNNVTNVDPRKDPKENQKIMRTNQENETIEAKQSNEQKWRCACEGSFLPPSLLRSFGGAEAIFKAGMGQCYHK